MVRPDIKTDVQQRAILITEISSFSHHFSSSSSSSSSHENTRNTFSSTRSHEDNHGFAGLIEHIYINIYISYIFVRYMSYMYAYTSFATPLALTLARVELSCHSCDFYYFDIFNIRVRVHCCELRIVHCCETIRKRYHLSAKS